MAETSKRQSRLAKAGFIGAGKMGSSIISGLLRSDKFSGQPLLAADPSPAGLSNMKESFPQLKIFQENSQVLNVDYLVLAVKPYMLPHVMEEIRSQLDTDTVLISIAAGITLEALESYAPPKQKIVRAMPNLPAMIQSGMTALCPNAQVSDAERSEVVELFEAVGEAVILPEKDMDTFSALAGSSPAWVFMLLEALADGAVQQGLPRAQCYRIAAQSVMGAARLALLTGEHPGVLKDQVCSPGGTTIDAVASLEKAGFRSALMEAIRVCTLKATELGKK